MMDINLAKIAMAIGYGEVWTNLLQPFWALPIIGIMRIKVTEIMGYTASIVLFVGVLFVIMLSLSLW